MAIAGTMVSQAFTCRSGSSRELLQHTSPTVYNVSEELHCSALSVSEKVYHVTERVYHVTERVYHVTVGEYHVTGDLLAVSERVGSSQ